MPGLGTSFGRGGATNFLQDLANSDCIVIEGSNMAECHPVGFQWVSEAKARGAKVVHIDPRFTRTSAIADLHVPLRAGSDIAFLGGLIKYVLDNDKYFPEYVVAYTNAAAILREDFRDTEDLDGLFSGYDPEHKHYDESTWEYEGDATPAAAGQRGPDEPGGKPARDAREGKQAGEHGPDVHEAAQHEAAGSGGPTVRVKPKRDETLQHPRCVFQVLKRHYARYTPEMVAQICGIDPQAFLQVAEWITANSGRDRTTAFVYSVGWTQHSVGAQYIRTASILQALLGNMGRPGGGIMALRGHASIQGSTDIPTLFNLLPGYLVMPHAQQHMSLEEYCAQSKNTAGFWGNMPSYMVSLLKAYFGDAATPENDFCFDHLPRLTGDHSSYQSVAQMIEGNVPGYFLVGENPVIGHANGRMQRFGLANLEWLVVRDLQMIESATFWKDAPEIETGELVTDQIATEVFFLPAASHVEKAGTFTQTQRLLQWRHKAVEPPGDARSDLWFYFHLGRLLKQRLANSTDPRDRPILDLAWDYPTEGETADPSPEAVLREINGVGPDGKALGAYTELKDDGSTSCGCWIYCGVYADEVNQSARRKPGRDQNAVAPEWGWAWPANRRILYNRASADPDGKPWSDRKKYVYWDDDAGTWTGDDVPDFEPEKRPDYRPPEGATAQAAIAGTDPFIMQSDGKAWLYAPAGLADGPMPTHYEPAESPMSNPLYGQQANPGREELPAAYNRGNPVASEVFPYVFTTYRLTEHHTAGGMSRTLPYLAELQPEFFVEVSPELAAERGLENGGWATVVTSRSAVEAKVLVTERIRPLRLDGRVIHQIGVPYHWGGTGISTGDSGNDLTGVVMDPNVHIQESKAATCDIRPGRRPRGPELVGFLEEYRRRAGVPSGTVPVGGRAPLEEDS
ncbi:formate dehydrogenase major subunit [Geodermatophilus daqingensis]|uniref:Formate dehydrogenase major subunit n=1 Tax=Petropleomorpha daqingensis TaxID=2026353 RepID=A0A853CF90_9ACTN|nr:formate dehydrogenase major subunit [Petropleomorpha daqingensis]